MERKQQTPDVTAVQAARELVARARVARINPVEALIAAGVLTQQDASDWFFDGMRRD
jgi:hypothetical protein